MADDGQPPPASDDAALRRERLATLGMLTAGTAHELNNTVGYLAANLRHLDLTVRQLLALVAQADALVRQPSHPTDAERNAWTAALASAHWDFVRDDLPSLLRDSSAGAEQLTHIVAGLKQYARGDSGRSLSSPDACVSAACVLLGWHLRHGIALEQHLDAAGHLPLLRTGVVQAVVNLLHNGIEAQNGQGRLRIETSQGPGWALISIEDDGPGVPCELRERIFQPFHSTKAAGTGLGLAMVQRVAQDHGGSACCVAAQHLRGARFELRLRGEA